MNGDMYVSCSPLGPIVAFQKTRRSKLPKFSSRTDPASEELSSTKLLLTLYSQLLRVLHIALISLSSSKTQSNL
jgi:hypothetical protein